MHQTSQTRQTGQSFRAHWHISCRSGRRTALSSWRPIFEILRNATTSLSASSLTSLKSQGGCDLGFKASSLVCCARFDEGWVDWDERGRDAGSSEGSAGDAELVNTAMVP